MKIRLSSSILYIDAASKFMCIDAQKENKMIICGVLHAHTLGLFPVSSDAPST